MELKTSELFVVKPSIVVEDYNNKKYFYEKNIVLVTHTVEFINRPTDISIAQYSVSNSFLKDIVDEKPYYQFISNHCLNGDSFVNVIKNDKILFAQYLWEMNMKTKYNDEIERYILSLKPFYDMEELKQILEYLKQSVPTTEKKLIIKKKSKQPIGVSLINNKFTS